MTSSHQVLDSFFAVAAAACADILAKPPDLVIVLMHVGRFSLLAAQTPRRSAFYGWKTSSRTIQNA